jgi:hypothetical protein
VTVLERRGPSYSHRSIGTARKVRVAPHVVYIVDLAVLSLHHERSAHTDRRADSRTGSKHKHHCLAAAGSLKSDPGARRIDQVNTHEALRLKRFALGWRERSPVYCQRAVQFRIATRRDHDDQHTDPRDTVLVHIEEYISILFALNKSENL